MKKLYYFLKEHTQWDGQRMLSLIALGLLQSIAMIGLPLILGRFLDSLAIVNQFSVMARFAFLYLFLGLFRVFSEIFSNYLNALQQSIWDYQITRKTIAHVQNMSILNPMLENPSKLNKQISSDSSQISGYFIASVIQFVMGTSQLLIPLIIILGLNWPSALTLLLINVLFVCSFRVFKEKLEKTSMNFIKEQANFITDIHGQVSHIESIQTQGLRDEYLNSLDNSYAKLRSHLKKQIIMQFSYKAIKDFLIILGTAILLLLSGQAYLSQTLSLGTITVILSYCQISLNATGLLYDLGGLLQENKSHINRMNEIYAGKTLETGKDLFESPLNYIRLDNLSFAYSGKKAIFQNFNLSIQRGKLYGLSGENGSGKSSLIKIILGLYINEQEGSVSYNEKDIRTLDMNQVRKRNVAVCEQEPTLLRGSILDHLGGEKILSHPRFEELMQLFDMSTLLAKLPEGLQTPVNDEKITLSGGEKQKIALCRTFLKDADFLILDEPTSALDSKAKEGFFKLLEKEKQNKIILMVSHDQEVLAIADECIGL